MKTSSVTIEQTSKNLNKSTQYFLKTFRNRLQYTIIRIILNTYHASVVHIETCIYNGNKENYI